MEIEIALGIPPSQREAVAAILYDALENEFRPIFGPRAQAVEIIAKYLREDRTITALLGDHTVGVAGLNFRGRRFFDVGMVDALREFGWGIFRVTFLGLMLEERVKRDELYLDSLAVATEHRNRGIGTSLLDSVAELARNQGLNRVRLHVVDSNLKAKTLYERLGFRTVRYQRMPFPWCKVFGFNGIYKMIKEIQSPRTD